MIKISKKLEYSLIALKYISNKQRGELTSAREITKKFNTPFDTTSKVLQVLNASGVLNSIQGIKGGYWLQRDLSKISVFELYQILEPKKIGVDCEPCLISSSCNISTPIKNLNTQVISFFKSMSVKDLFRDTKLINILQEVTA